MFCVVCVSILSHIPYSYRCGNGLLVYVLSAEGYVGRGIDLRRRKTWDALSVKAVLEERAVFPDRVRFGRGPAFAATTNLEAAEASRVAEGVARGVAESEHVGAVPVDPLWDTVAWQDEPEVEWMIGNHWYGDFFFYRWSCLLA
jgi:hypothetical protein